MGTKRDFPLSFPTFDIRRPAQAATRRDAWAPRMSGKKKFRRCSRFYGVWCVPSALSRYALPTNCTRPGTHAMRTWHPLRRHCDLPPPLRTLPSPHNDLTCMRIASKTISRVCSSWAFNDRVNQQYTRLTRLFCSQHRRATFAGLGEYGQLLGWRRQLLWRRCRRRVGTPSPWSPRSLRGGRKPAAGPAGAAGTARRPCPAS